MSFQNFSNYRFAFNRLDSKLASPDAQKRYYNKCMQKYATIFKGEEKVSVAVEWDLRCRKALREIFSSATFFIEAKKDLEMKCFLHIISACIIHYSTQFIRAYFWMLILILTSC